MISSIFSDHKVVKLAVKTDRRIREKKRLLGGETTCYYKTNGQWCNQRGKKKKKSWNER